MTEGMFRAEGAMADYDYDYDWYSDTDHNDVARQAEHATRSGWAAIAGTVGGLGCALMLVAVVCVGAFLACVYVVMATDY